MVDILQMSHLNAYSWMEMFESLLKFHWFVPKGSVVSIGSGDGLALSR